MKLEPYRVGGERSARQSRPLVGRVAMDCVENMEGRLVGTEVLQPGHDPLPVARKILREKRK
jgi:hypothetical protein